jgi:hypothetical protein
MKPDDALFEALRAASKRPYSRFPLNYESESSGSIPLPHLAPIKGLCQRISLRTCAELAADDSDKAMADEQLILDLTDSIESEPFLVSHLVRSACFQIAIQPVWEGLAEHRWQERELETLQSRFLRYHFLDDIRIPLQTERGFIAQDVEILRTSGLGLADDLGSMDMDVATPHKRFLDVVGHVLPAGWYNEECLACCQCFDAQMRGVIDFSNSTIFPGRSASNYSTLSHKIVASPFSISIREIMAHRVMTPHLLEQWRDLPYKAAIPQTAANQAAIACALERYRLANGQYPENLAVLAPTVMKKLPNDVINGEPYHYHPTKDGRYVLYSIGWNGKDENGIPGRSVFDMHAGDWVWSFPSN